MKDPAELWQTALISGAVGFVSAGISRVIEMAFKNRFDRRLQAEKNRFDLYKERLKIIQTLRQISNPYAGYETLNESEDARTYLRERLRTAARYRSALEESRAYLPQTVVTARAEAWSREASPVFDVLELMLRSADISLSSDTNDRLSILARWMHDTTFAIDQLIERDGTDLLPAVEAGRLGVGA